MKASEEEMFEYYVYVLDLARASLHLLFIG